MKVRGELMVKVIAGHNLEDKDGLLGGLVTWDVSDCWVKVSNNNIPILTTRVINNQSSPHWNESAIVPLCTDDNVIHFAVYDDDHYGCDFIGETRIEIRSLNKEWVKNGKIPLKDKAGALEVNLRFTPYISEYTNNLDKPLHFLNNACYGCHKGGSLQLYNDAHPKLNAEVQGLWSSIADAFENAKTLIYISGWSLWTEIKLKRSKEQSSETLGELLKRRASEGVRVLVLLWSEKFSTKQCAGLVGTFDKMTVDYFSDSKVTAIAVLREKKESCKLEEKIIETLFTHHSKLIVADRPQGDLIAYTGGLDLTNGRWDTPEHTLWSTLTNYHQNDFYNGFFTSIMPGHGPREPWHDTHSCITGPITVDLLNSFENRWRLQVPDHADILLKDLDQIKEKCLQSGDMPDRINWYMQVLQTIDSDSTIFDESSNNYLNCNDGHKLDISIHRGIVSLIRQSKRFLYIESQYFIGSSQYWETKNDVEAYNIVPIEIAEQICSSIREGHGLRVYLTVPLAPEGDPSHLVSKSSINAILYWQYLTIKMMYKKIAATLREVKSEDHPTDYLLVLCLGQRRSKSRVARSVEFDDVDFGSIQWKFRQTRRFPIYVHSKMLISDDARIIIGSPNLNQRSLDGARDTELAIAASQVQNMNGNEELVHNGDVSKFRSELWWEHTGGLSHTDASLADPGSLACIRRVRELADETLVKYNDQNFKEGIQCRFMRYPLDINQEGEVDAWPGISKLPDLNVPVKGHPSSFIPALATT